MLIDTPVSDLVSSILETQWKRMPDRDSREVFGRRVGARLEAVLLECVDWDLRPPTPAQVSFATAISRTLGIDLPGDVLRQRGAMGDFLNAHSETYKAKLK